MLNQTLMKFLLSVWWRWNLELLLLSHSNAEKLIACVSKIEIQEKMQNALVCFRAHMPTFWTWCYIDHIHYIRISKWTRCTSKYNMLLLFLEMPWMSIMLIWHHVSVLTSPFKDTNLQFFASPYIFSDWSTFNPKNE